MPFRHAASHLLQLTVDVLNDQVDGHHVSTTFGEKTRGSGLIWTDPGAELDPASRSVGLTSGHHDVCQPHARLDVLLKGRLDELVVLFDDAVNVPAALRDVPAQAAHEPDVGVCVHEDLHVQELQSDHSTDQLNEHKHAAIGPNGRRVGLLEEAPCLQKT